MPISVKSPLEKEFHLAKSDEELGNTDGATMVTVRQARQGDFELVDDLTAEFKREYDGITVKSIQRISFDDIRRKQVYLTLVGSNLLDEDEKSPLFKFKGGKSIDEVQFRASWSKLPPVIANEIHEKVLEMNPLWDERVPQPKVEAPEKSGEEDSQRE